MTKTTLLFKRGYFFIQGIDLLTQGDRLPGDPAIGNAVSLIRALPDKLVSAPQLLPNDFVNHLARLLI